MSTLARAIIPLGLLLASTAFAADKTEKRTVGAFTSIGVASGIHLVTREGAAGTLEVRADEKELAELVTEVKDGGLQIHWQQHGPGLTSVHHGDATVTVPTPALRALSASGGAQAEVHALAGDDVALAASGGAHVKVASLSGKQVTVAASGGSIVDLAGAGGERATIQLSGGGKLHAADVPFASAVVAASGGATAELRVSASLQFAGSGGAHLDVHGKPQVTQQTSGGASVNLE